MYWAALEFSAGSEDEGGGKGRGAGTRKEIYSCKCYGNFDKLFFYIQTKESGIRIEMMQFLIECGCVQRHL